MKKQNILCHRGIWKKKIEQNSEVAIKKALENGFGVEIDLRYHEKNILISHDPLGRQRRSDIKAVSLETVFEIASATESKGYLALNAKEDNLQEEVRRLAIKYNIDRYFLFDMSVPDLIGGAKHDVNQFGRLSSYEDPCKIAEFCCGLWIDGFDNSEKIYGESLEIIKKWPRCAFVSPELHGREKKEGWKVLKQINQRHSDMMICTDEPYEALEYFGS